MSLFKIHCKRIEETIYIYDNCFEPFLFLFFYFFFLGGGRFRYIANVPEPSPCLHLIHIKKKERKTLALAHFKAHSSLGS